MKKENRKIAKDYRTSSKKTTKKRNRWWVKKRRYIEIKKESI